MRAFRLSDDRGGNGVVKRRSIIRMGHMGPGKGGAMGLNARGGAMVRGGQIKKVNGGHTAMAKRMVPKADVAIQRFRVESEGLKGLTSAALGFRVQGPRVQVSWGGLGSKTREKSRGGKNERPCCSGGSEGGHIAVGLARSVLFSLLRLSRSDDRPGGLG